MDDVRVYVCFACVCVLAQKQIKCKRKRYVTHVILLLLLLLVRCDGEPVTSIPTLLLLRL